MRGVAFLGSSALTSVAGAVGAGAFFFAAGLRPRRGLPLAASATSAACSATTSIAFLTSAISSFTRSTLSTIFSSIVVLPIPKTF